ncbi:hypothetical protein [Actinomadura rubteroloni]|uniref:hypothetical protein n=1 Tax=Actinomadura rubteroloni TaxID=1926885 RepID=UPI00196B5F82|nr:hypothetical protein [Actinomadura rubteroloni]
MRVVGQGLSERRRAAGRARPSSARDTDYEIARIVGAPCEPSAEPLTDPWAGRAAGTLLRGLGFTATVCQAQRDGLL